MIPFEEIERAKAVSIPMYLSRLGFLPKIAHPEELLYHSPLRTETTPSFFVHPEKNVFKDFGQEEYKGDVVRLCQLLEQLTFPQAVKRLNEFEGISEDLSFSFSGPTPTGRSNKLLITQTRPLEHVSLSNYLLSRGIPIEIASVYLKQIHYQYNHRNYFALGFKNDSGGYALRNGAGFKGQTQPSGITTILGTQPGTVCLFEGFFDFLSALVHYQRINPKYTTIILNSTTNLSKAITQLQAYDQVNIFLDRDKTGHQSIQKLEKMGLPINNCTWIYAGFKDFNEFLVAK